MLVLCRKRSWHLTNFHTDQSVDLIALEQPLCQPIFINLMPKFSDPSNMIWFVGNIAFTLFHHLHSQSTNGLEVRYWITPSMSWSGNYTECWESGDKVRIRDMISIHGICHIRGSRVISYFSNITSTKAPNVKSYLSHFVSFCICTKESRDVSGEICGWHVCKVSI